jgi:outer membrane protein TolC
MSQHRSGRRASAPLLALTAVAFLGAPLAAQRPTAAAAPAAGAQGLSLDEALALVERRSEAVRIAAAGVERAQGQLRQARSQLVPQLTGSVGFQRTIQSQFQEISERFAPEPGEEPEPGGDDIADSPIARIFASENTVTLGLQLNQNLFTGGRVLAQGRAARAGRRAAELGVRTALAEAQLEVTEAYFDALLADRLVAIAESSLVQTERTFRQARLARDVGTTAEFDVLRAQVTRDNQRPAVIQARTQRDVAYLRLRQLLELPATQPLALTTALESAAPPVRLQSASNTAPVTRVDEPVDVEALLAERAVAPEALAATVARTDTVVAGRSAVRQARENVVAQEQQLAAVRAQRLPSLALSSQYQRFAYPIGGVPALNDFFPNWTVSVGVQLPLLTGGRVRGELQVAQANLAEARAQQQQAEEIAALDAQLALAQFEQAAEAYAASAGTAEQATRAYTIAEVRYREGISTQVELTDSRLLLQQALANRAQAARDLSVAQARLALLPDLPLGAGAGQGGGVPAGGSGAAGQGSGAPGGAPQQQGRSAAGGAGGFSQQGQPGGTP